jgi:hypothetical protein
MTKRRIRPYITILLLAPFIAFAAQAFLAAKLARASPWQKRCLELWKNQQWLELKAFGENLWESGDSDPQILCLAMLASEQLHQKTSVDAFAQRILQTKGLNLRIELETARRLHPQSVRQKVMIYRTRIVLALFLCISMLNLLSFWRGGGFRTASATLSLAGFILMMW